MVDEVVAQHEAHEDVIVDDGLVAELVVDPDVFEDEVLELRDLQVDVLVVAVFDVVFGAFSQEHKVRHRFTRNEPKHDEVCV